VCHGSFAANDVFRRTDGGSSSSGSCVIIPMVADDDGDHRGTQRVGL
jgi:hypothetical protein